MKKNGEKTGARTKIITTLIGAGASLVVGLYGGSKAAEIRINQKSKQQVETSSVTNITNNVDSTTDVIQYLIDQVNEKDKKLDKKDKEIEKLNEENNKLKDSSQKESVQNTTDNSSESGAKDDTTDDTKASTDADILALFHDGVGETKYVMDDNDGSFKIGGKDYYSGVTIVGSETGYVLVSLDGKYTHMSFDVGRVDDTSISDGKLLIIKDKVKSKEYDLDGEKSLMSVDFDVTGTKDLKIQLNSDWTTYGFVNIKLE